jgi:hypothetical protein
VRQSAQVNSVVLGDGKVFMRCSDVHRTSSACLRDPPRLCSTKDAKGAAGIRMDGAVAVRWLTGVGSWQRFRIALVRCDVVTFAS